MSQRPTTLQEMDISGQLASLHSAIDKLQRQANSRAQEQEDARVEHELRLQQLEQRQAAAEATLRQMQEQIDEALSQQAAEFDELRQAMRGMMSQVVGRIADQFDAVQASLEEAIAGRATDAATQAEAVACLQTDLADLRTHNEAQVTTLRDEFTELLTTETRSTAAHAAEHASSLSAVTERLTALEQAQTAAVAQAVQGSEKMQEALNEWQRGMEGRLGETSSKIDQYRSYVSRLRHEVRELQEETSGAHTALVEALARELSGLGNGVALLQQDAAGLLGQARDRSGGINSGYS